MDEYLFMTLAKLKADRLKLEREQRLAATDPEQLRLDWAEPALGRMPECRERRDAQDRRDTHRHSARWFSQQPLWREQS